MSTTNRDDNLSRAEVRQLGKLEATVNHGLDTHITVAEALTDIRDVRLHRDTHVTFEAYLRERWGLGSQPELAPLSSEDHDTLRSNELLGQLRWLVTQATGTVANAAHQLKTRAAEVDDVARAQLRGDVVVLDEELATLKALLAVVDWDAECGRLLAGEIPPFEGGVDDNAEE
jgi:hypothetical protein